MKRCTRCGQEKPPAAFYAYRGRPWGAVCKACVLEARSERYERDRDLLLARVKDYQARVRSGETVTRRRSSTRDVRGGD